MEDVLESVLSNRTPSYRDTLLFKLNQEGIHEPLLLKQLSREGIENSLGSKPEFDLEEISDIIRVRKMIIRNNRNFNKPGSKKESGKANKWQHNRSRSRSGGRCRQKWQHNPNRSRSGGRCKQKNKSSRGSKGKGRSKRDKQGVDRQRSPDKDTILTVGPLLKPKVRPKPKLRLKPKLQPKPKKNLLRPKLRWPRAKARPKRTPRPPPEPPPSPQTAAEAWLTTSSIGWRWNSPPIWGWSPYFGRWIKPKPHCVMCGAKTFRAVKCAYSFTNGCKSFVCGPQCANAHYHNDRCPVA